MIIRKNLKKTKQSIVTLLAGVKRSERSREIKTALVNEPPE